MTWDSTGDSRLYIDGELFQAETKDPKTFETNNIWYFGDDVCCSGREINGQIDDVAFFDRELEPDEISIIYPLGEFGSSIKDMIATYVESISFNTKSFSIPIGLTDTIKTEILPVDATDKSVVWKSLNETIATVDFDGVITGVSEGDVKIVGETTDGGFTDTASVTVYRIYPESIEITPSTLTLKEDEYASLTAKVLPENTTDNSFEWLSEDETVATVNKVGLVHGIKKGVTNITATTLYGNKIATCKVEVRYVHVDSVVLSHKEVIMQIDDTITLYALVDPSDAQNKTIVWSSDKANIATVDVNTGFVKAIDDGIANIEAYSWDQGKTAICVVKVGNYPSAIINEETVQTQIYPNPASSVVHISGLTEDVEKLEVFNVRGRMVMQKTVNGHGKTIKLDVSEWTQGIYLVKIHYRDNPGTIKYFVR